MSTRIVDITFKPKRKNQTRRTICSSSYEHFYQNGLVVKFFDSREQNEHVIAFFYKIR